MDARLQRFRELMTQIDPAEDPGRALERGEVVPHPSGLGPRVADHLIVRPASSHVVVGGIGSGKTTELLSAQQVIDAHADMEAFYVDVSREQELSALRESDLLLLFGLALAASPKDNTNGNDEKEAIKALKRLAHGYREPIDPSDGYVPDDGERSQFIEGRLKRPLTHWFTRPVNATAVHVQALLPKRPKPNRVVIFDSLDRVEDDALLTRLLEQDLRKLVGLGVGVVIAMPQRLLYGARRSLIDRVEQFHHLPYLDVERDEEAVMFMLAVLNTRTPDGMLPDKVARRLVAASGGVLRDLITLTRMASQRAFSRGADGPEPVDATQAIQAFGDDHRLGLDAERVTVLNGLRRSQRFVPTTDVNLELLETRRILHYAGRDGDRFVLHPAMSDRSER